MQKNNPTTLEEAYAIINEHGFSRITEKIVLMWGDPLLGKYLDSLLISDRQNRQGFPPDVGRALLFIHSAHQQEFPSTDNWIQTRTGWVAS